MNWQLIIEERNAWVEHNFPNRAFPNPIESILGVVEEIGELAHAHLKAAQNIRGDGHQHVLNAKDAVGDITIYLLGVMNHFGYHPSDIVGTTPSPELIIIDLAHAAGSIMSQPAMAIDHIVSSLRAFCMAQGWDFDELVQQTWDEVKKRDWIEYPDTGLPPVLVNEPTHLTEEEKALGIDGK